MELDSSAGIQTLECGNTPARILGLRARGRSGKPVSENDMRSPQARFGVQHE